MQKLGIIILIVGNLSFAWAQDLRIADFVKVESQEQVLKGDTNVVISPEIKANTLISPYKRRFQYLVYNVPEANLLEKYKPLYPDSSGIEANILRDLQGNPDLMAYFAKTLKPFQTKQQNQKLVYRFTELMEVAAKFFYCDEIKQDSSISARICLGLNGVKEANWSRDYTLLEAFCYESIFHKISDQRDFKIMSAFLKEKEAVEAYYSQEQELESLEKYFQKVKLGVFAKMKENETLKQELRAYYEEVKENLSFKILP